MTQNLILTQENYPQNKEIRRILPELSIKEVMSAVHNAITITINKTLIAKLIFAQKVFNNNPKGDRTMEMLLECITEYTQDNVDHIVSAITDKMEEKAFQEQLHQPPLYKNRGEEDKNMNPEEFIKLHYSELLERKLLYLKDLRKKDKYLVDRLYVYCDKHNKNANDIVPNIRDKVQKEIALYNTKKEEFVKGTLQNDHNQVVRVQRNVHKYKKALV